MVSFSQVRKESVLPLPIELSSLIPTYPADDKELVEMNEPVRQQAYASVQDDHTLIELEQRERDVRQIEEDIIAVNDIFKDLGTLIHDQGTVVDSIESHVEFTAENVENGVQQLREASASQNKLRKKKMILTVVLIIVVAIILYLLFR